MFIQVQQVVPSTRKKAPDISAHTCSLLSLVNWVFLKKRLTIIRGPLRVIKNNCVVYCHWWSEFGVHIRLVTRTLTIELKGNAWHTFQSIITNAMGHNCIWLIDSLIDRLTDWRIDWLIELYFALVVFKPLNSSIWVTSNGINAVRTSWVHLG